MATGRLKIAAGPRYTGGMPSADFRPMTPEESAQRAAEILRQSEIRLTAQAATAAAISQRAAAICGMLVAGAAALSGASLAYIASHGFEPWMAGTLGMAAGLYAAAAIAMLVATPADFHYVGTRASILEKGTGDLTWMRLELARLHEDRIDKNTAAILRDGRLLTLAIRLGMAAPLVGLCAFLAAHVWPH